MAAEMRVGMIRNIPNTYTGYVDWSSRAIHVRRQTDRRIREREMLESFRGTGCPVQCGHAGRWACEHEMDLVDSILDAVRQEYGYCEQH